MSTDADLPSLRDAGPRSPGRRRGLILPLVVGVAAGALGWALGSHHNEGNEEKHGTAYSGPGQISATAGGVTYNIPLQVDWLDADGIWHDNTRPDCLPPNFKQIPVTFGAVEWQHHELGGYTVPWVDCSR